mgnify:CR=1 FL=1
MNFPKESILEDILTVNKQYLGKKAHLCSTVLEEDDTDLIRMRLVQKCEKTLVLYIDDIPIDNMKIIDICSFLITLTLFLMAKKGVNKLKFRDK